MNTRLIAVLVAGACALTPVQVQGQVETVGSVGLGRSLRPLDARAIALGNTGVALHGGNLSSVNPASLTRIGSAGVWITMQPEKRTLRGDQIRGVVETANFPLARAALPLSDRWVIGAAFGALFDQDWGVEFKDTITVSTGDVEFDETRTSDGGISQLRFEVGTYLSDAVTLGVAGLFYTGEARQTVRRVFEESVGFDIFRSQTAIRYRGWGVALGGEFQPRAEVVLGATLNWNEGLTVRDDSAGVEVEVGLPIGLDVGGSFQLTRDFLVALALGWTNWSSAEGDLPRAGVVDTWRFGGGTELRVVSGENTQMFLRFGGHLERSPFELGDGAPWERVLSVGGGAAFRGGRGRFDFAVEFGGRGDAEKNLVEEDFIRYSFTMAVFTI
ncbi:MAG: hypothetical protein JSU87_07730 [Gemmatimonadota bacterium]|nr:MAG: hypothetical protein JSU87_07730 [Gemmatimonadota bacterium]